MTSEPEWHALAGALSEAGLAADHRFSDAQRRLANDAELAALLEGVLKTRTGDEWFRLLDGAGVPCEIANGAFGKEIFADLVLRDQGLIVEHQHPVLGRFEQFGTAIGFSATPGVVDRPPPVIGQHTREILAEHGFDDGRIEALLAARVVFEDLWVD